MDGYISNENSIKNKYKKKFIIPMFFVFAVLVIVGVSYALWQLTFTQTGTNVITTGCLKLILSDDTDAINLTDATPISDEDGKKLVPYTFTLENMCTTETAYVINLETLSNGDKILADNYIRATLTDENNELFFDNLLETHVNEEKVIEEATKAYKLHQGKLGNSEKISFNLRIWLDEKTEAIDEVMNASWEGKITVTANYVPPVSNKNIMIPMSIETGGDDQMYGYTKNITYLGEYNNGTLNSPIHVEFQNSLNPYSNAEQVVDFSVSQDKSVLGYYVQDDGLKLYIQAAGKIRVNPIASYYGLAYQTYFGQGSVGGIENLDTSLVTDMSYMFYMSIIKSESESSSINLNHFDTSNVTNMSHMFDLFYETGVLEIDKWDMSKVTDMSYMFQFCRSIKTTINITNQNIENYEGMFLNAATSEGAEITVNYTTETSDLVDRMIATKSENSNVVKGTLIK